METNVCKSCGKELPLGSFCKTRWGGRFSICNSCVTEKKADTRHNHAQMGGGKFIPFSDPDFDGKQPVEVIQLMSRAKRWLETRGYSITLKGTYTQVKDVKF